MTISGHCLQFVWSYFLWKENGDKKSVDHSDSLTPDLLNPYLRHLSPSGDIRQPIWFKSVCSFLLPPSTTRWQKWYFFHQQKPSLSQDNGLLPPPLQLPALLSFSSSGFLRQRQAAADRTAQARGQLGKRGRDSWTCCQLHWLWPGTVQPHTHSTSLMSWCCTFKPTCGHTVCRLKWTFRNGKIKSVSFIYSSP